MWVWSVGWWWFLGGCLCFVFWRWNCGLVVGICWIVICLLSLILVWCCCSRCRVSGCRWVELRWFGVVCILCFLKFLLWIIILRRCRGCVLRYMICMGLVVLVVRRMIFWGVWSVFWGRLWFRRKWFVCCCLSLVGMLVSLLLWWLLRIFWGIMVMWSFFFGLGS